MLYAWQAFCLAAAAQPDTACRSSFGQSVEIKYKSIGWLVGWGKTDLPAYT